MPKLREKIEAAGPFLRDIVFGVHDALLTNIGIVTGFVTALQSNQLIVTAALIDVFISAFAMAIGTYLSRTSESEYLKGQVESDTHEELQGVLANPIMAAVVMWITYVVSGFIPLVPFFFGIEPVMAMRYGVVLALMVFFGVGALKGVLTRTGIWFGGLQFVGLGSVAALIGYLIGVFGQRFLG